MKGLDKFKAEFKTELDNLKDKKKKDYYDATVGKIFTHIEEVADEEYDDLMLQDHKSFRNMWSYIMENAQALAVEGCAFVNDDTVYGWVDTYMGLDDKSEVDKKLETKTEDGFTQASIFDLF